MKFWTSKRLFLCLLSEEESFLPNYVGREKMHRFGSQCSSVEDLGCFWDLVITIKVAVNYCKSTTCGQWFNQLCLCNKASIKTQIDRIQRASRLVNTWRSGGNGPPGEGLLDFFLLKTGSWLPFWRAGSPQKEYLYSLTEVGAGCGGLGKIEGKSKIIA